MLAVLGRYPVSGSRSEHLVVGMMRSRIAECSRCAATHASLVTRVTENSSRRKSRGSTNVSEFDRIDRIIAEHSEARAIWTNIRPRSGMRMNRRSAVQTMNHLSLSARTASRVSTKLAHLFMLLANQLRTETIATLLLDRGRVMRGERERLGQRKRFAGT